MFFSHLIYKKVYVYVYTYVLHFNYTVISASARTFLSVNCRWWDPLVHNLRASRINKRRPRISETRPLEIIRVILMSSRFIANATWFIVRAHRGSDNRIIIINVQVDYHSGGEEREEERVREGEEKNRQLFACD